MAPELDETDSTYQPRSLRDGMPLREMRVEGQRVAVMEVEELS